MAIELISSEVTRGYGASGSGNSLNHAYVNKIKLSSINDNVVTGRRRYRRSMVYEAL